MNFIIIFTIFACVQSQNDIGENWPTQILTKNNTIYKTINCACDSDFLSFIERSTVWVDKSVLIAKIWAIGDHINNDVYIITGPPRWGKTTILKIIKFYHQPELDEHGDVVDVTQTAAYKYFVEGIVVLPAGCQPEYLNTRPMISTYHNLNNAHLAKHPVITLNGNHLDIEDPTSIRRMISSTFDTYQISTLVRKWRCDPDQYTQELNYFDKYSNDNGSLPLSEFILGINVLSSILQSSYKRQVIIIYDEHDYYLQHAYFRTDRVPFKESAQSILFLKTLESFMQTTFKRNPYLAKGFITGVLGVHQATFLSGLSNVYCRNIFTDSYLFPFYGFFESEFRSAMKVANLNEEFIANARKWYDGYHTLTHPNETMFSTYSISICITTNDVENFWIKSVSSNFIPELLNHHQFREDIMQLLKTKSTGLKISRNYLNIFGIEDLALIQRLYLGLEPYERKKHRGVVFSMLISIGFMTFHNVDNADIEVCLPNREILSYVNTNWLDSMKINGIKYGECYKTIRKLVFGSNENILYKLSKCVSSVLLQEDGGPLCAILAEPKNIDPKEQLHKMNSSDCVMYEATLENIFYIIIQNALKFDSIRLDELTDTHLKSVQQADRSPPFMNRHKTDMLFIIKNKMALIFENKFYGLTTTNPKPALTHTHSQALAYSAFFIPYNLSDIPVFKFIALHGEHSGKVEVRCANLSFEQLESAMDVSKSKLITEISSKDGETSAMDVLITTTPSLQEIKTTYSTKAEEKKSTEGEKMTKPQTAEELNYQIWNSSMWNYIEAIKPSVISIASYDPAKTPEEDSDQSWSLFH